MTRCPELQQSHLVRYEYTRTLSPARWAWEFLRRNPEFLADASGHGLGEVSVRPACHGITLIRPRTGQMAAGRWGLAFFPNPRRNGFDADVFWLPALLAHRVHVQVSPAETGTICEIYEKSLRHCRITHLVDTAGHEHMLVRGNGQVVQVECTGMSMLSPVPVRLAFIIGDTVNFCDRYKILKDAQCVYGEPDDRRSWTRTSLALRNALIAHDCETAGLSLRETAAVIYGKSRSDEAWAAADRAIKDEMRRARKRGRELVAGRYLDLLGASQASSFHPSREDTKAGLAACPPAGGADRPDGAGRPGSSH